ncbi:MAG: cache domain-containing protein, partial [Actinobacteria bacterium]|nr:cache domain-containing protein [Actinomycetota bacterium]
MIIKIKGVNMISVFNTLKNSASRYFSANIRNKLKVTLLIVTIIPLTIIGFFTYNFSSEKVKSDLEKNSKNSLKQIAINIDNILSEMETMSLMAYSDKDVARILGKTKDEISFEVMNDAMKMEGMLKSISMFRKDIEGVYHNLIFSEKSRYIYYYNDVSVSLEGVDQNKDYFIEDWYKAVKEKNGKNMIFGAHTPFAKRLSGKLVFGLARVIKDLAEYNNDLGIILIEIDLETIENICNPEDNKSMQIIITDSEGKIIYSSRKNEIMEKLNIDTDIMNKILAAKEGSGKLNMDKQEMFVNYVTSEFSGWKIIQFIPRKV